MNDTQRIRHIDAWRFIAVNMVIVSHVIDHNGLDEIYPFLRFFLPYGSFGVLIFFFISGFVICRGLMQEKTTTSVVSLKAFYLRRTFRILPPLWLFLATLAGLAAVGVINITTMQIGRSALFVCNFQFMGGCSMFASHTWSLAYEEQFYVLFPIFFIVAGLIKNPRIILILVFFVITFSVACYLLGLNGVTYYLTRMNYLLMGCAAAIFYDRLYNIFKRLSFFYWLVIWAILIIFIGLERGPSEIYLRTILLYPIGISILVLGTPVGDYRVSAFFQSSFIVYLGKISYTVYLWQQLATASWPMLAPWWTVIFILGIWLFAHFSYQYFERPLIRVANRWSDAIKQRALAGRAPGFAQ